MLCYSSIFCSSLVREASQMKSKKKAARKMICAKPRGENSSNNCEVELVIPTDVCNATTHVWVIVLVLRTNARSFSFFSSFRGFHVVDD